LAIERDAPAEKGNRFLISAVAVAIFTYECESNRKRRAKFNEAA
jgi:hypothetical protein